MAKWRLWLAAAGVGAVAGLLAAAVWSGVDRSIAACTVDFCELGPPVIAWLVEVPLLAFLGWLLVRWLGGGGWLPAASIALVGSILGFVGLRVWDSFVYGSPRPPLVVCLLAGALGYTAAAVLVRGGRWERIGAGAAATLLLGAGIVGSATSPARDRSYTFSAVAGIILVPDPDAFHVVAADGDPGHLAVVLRVEPVGGGPAIALIESTRPGTWQPPDDCGPQLRYTVTLKEKAVDSPCAPYPDGGWQRPFPDGVQLVDAHGSTLVVAEPWIATAPVPAAALRHLVVGLRAGSPSDLVQLPGT